MDIVHDTYVAEAPSNEALINLFEGQWVSMVPGFSVGEVPLFADDRVQWAIDQAQGVANKKVLELGPLEGGHTSMLLNSGAESVTAIEANTLCYLRCLAVQQVLGLDRATFLLGNFVPWLQATTERFDYVQAAGVLYHMVDPVPVLESICAITDQVYLWTHYADETHMPPSDGRYKAGITGVEEAEYAGATYRKYRRRYLGNPEKDPKFCGGVHKNPAWIEKDTILRVLDAQGFDVQVNHDMPKHPGGPCASFFAQRRA